jgi:UDP-N-acetylmuramoyl-L-alanyl-D-glutamate--2,6-diaminopimelate ligase
MGAIAGKLADFIVLTSDNPRSENPHAILEQILTPIQNHPGLCVIENRKAAIEYALTHKQSEDIVIVAGKGHETTQTIGSSILAFSDQETIRNFGSKGT